MGTQQTAEDNATKSPDVLPITSKHEIIKAINKFLHQIRDIEFCARTFIPAAAQIQEERAK